MTDVAPEFADVGDEQSPETRGLTELAERYRLIVDLSPDGIAVHQDGRVVYINPAGLRYLRAEPQQVIGQPITNFVHPDSIPDMVKRLLALTEERTATEPSEAVMLRIDGETIDAQVVSVRTWWAGRPAFQVILRDISLQKEVENALRYRAALVEHVTDAIIATTAEGIVQAWNPAAEHIYGRSAEDAIGMPLPDAVGADLDLDAILAEGGTVETTHHRVDDGEIAVRASAAVMAGNGYVLVCHDETARRRAQERLHYAATHDALTELCNRAAVVSRLEAVLHEPDSERLMLVSFIDLNDFKTLNDSLGHAIGDQVLRIVAQRLRGAVRPGDVVGRIGGDEFVVVTSAPVGGDVGSQAARLRRILTAPIDVDGKLLRIDASIGVVSVAAGDPRTSTEVLRDADIAMYHAKSIGRAGYAVFNVELRERMQRRQLLEQGLRAPEAASQLSTVYQPIVEVRTGRIHAVEALLRWTHPTLGPISPCEFIPLAEESDLIDVLGRFVLTRATADIADLRREHPDLHVSVNLSVRQTTYPDLIPVITRALEVSGLPPRALYVEITESAVMSDPVAAASALASLRGLGVRVALDDFGTGYSSLVQLNRLPLDVIKIGKPFVDDLGTSPQADAIVLAMIGVAHSTGRLVVAEGVQTPGQLAMLRDYGCDAAQGFLLAHPMPLAELRTREWLTSPDTR